MTRELTKKERFIQLITPVALPLARFYWFVFRPRTEGVKVIIFNKDRSEVLLVRHTYGDGRWMFPGGGKEGEESPEKIARREMDEELRVSLQDLKRVDTTTSRKEWKRDQITILTAEITDDPTPDPFEIARAKWFPWSDLPQLGPVSAKILYLYAQAKPTEN